MKFWKNERVVLLQSNKNMNDNELLYLISENIEEADNIVYDKYKPVIEKYAKKYLPMVINKGLDYNDLYQEGLIGLISAIKSYKENKNIKFSSFAFMCIERKILSAVKIAGRQKNAILNESYSLDYDEGENLLFNNIISNNEEELLDKLVKEENEEIINNKIKNILTKNEYNVYLLRIRGFTYEEISSILNKSVKSVGSCLGRIKIKLKQIMNEND